jgi:Ca2+-transporting ATPase
MSIISKPACPLTPQFVDFVPQRSAQMASQGLRVLALALKKISSASARDMAADTKNTAAAESSLTFVGLIGLINPARSGVK